MFTGLVEGCGQIHGLTPQGAAVRLTVDFPETLQSGNAIGDSIAINGCCLTVVEIEGSIHAFEAGEETLSKTNLGDLEIGDPVNLERSLAVDARLGGHFVQGHVDGVGSISSIERDGEWVFMSFHVPPELTDLMVSKGSIAVDGVSLTLVKVEPESFQVALIPHTLDVTTLGGRKVGDRVNIETDILGKYVRKFLGQ
ncbi:MAG: riboflavin synthase [Planctomycetaceae bacterium]